MKRKSPVQFQALESFYLEQMYPSPTEMEDLGKSLGLTVNEVRGWFKRRRSRRKDGKSLASDRSLMRSSTSSRCDFGAGVEKRCSVGTRKASSQTLLTSQHILAKIFRKDGPLLGSEFDHLPSGALKASWLGSSTADLQNQRVAKKRKISELMDHTSQDCVEKNAIVRKHGIGKGLMTVWRVMNRNRRDVSPCFDLLDERATISQSSERNPPHQKKKQRQLASILKQKLLQKRSTEKKRRSINREAELNKDETQRAFKEKCELALDGEVFKETCQTMSALVDDEELEMREAANPLACSCHLSGTGSHGCFLCKDLLPKFPPNAVQMRLPFGLHPWNSSPESVKKLFKVVHFLYTYSVTCDICPFTLDEVTRAFHDKDSLRLGKIHLSLLKLLLLDVETELQRGSFSNLSISCKFLALLQSVESQIHILDLWKDSLNSLTWTEILRQILVAAGFGSVKCAVQSEELSKERRLMKKYGLRLGTLKGELFRLLNKEGNNGLKISELANAAEVAVLNLATASEEQEHSISSILASDITLFEKISESTYRVRVNCFFSENPDKSQSDSDESGSVDDESDDCSFSSGDEIERISENLALQKVKCSKRRRHKSKMPEGCSEIDESHPGEPWLLGLMEGEYSDLRIEEKLDVFVALIDLLSSGSTIRMEDLPRAVVDFVPAPSIYSHGSGGKIKRSSSDQYGHPRVSWVHGGERHGMKDLSKSSDSHPVDSSSVSGAFAKQDGDKANSGHPMQSVYLGSDRRFNRYWLFVGPCTANDPGHRCVYFESSEDGHWEVISDKEALRSLLSVLDDRGIREARLIESLEKRERFLCEAMLSRQVTQSETDHFTDIVREDSSSPVSDIDNNLCLNEIANDRFSSQRAAIVFEIGSKREKSLLWSLLQEFDEWIWANFYLNLSAVKHGRKSYLESLTRCKSCHDLYWRDEKHCKICHATFELDIDLEERYAIHAATCREKEESDAFPHHRVLSSQLQSLKAAVYAIESAMPEDALIGVWRKSAHRLWAKRLRRSSTLSELIQVIGDFVGAISEVWLWHSGDEEHCNATIGETISCFPSLPQTTSAIALWLVKLDTLIAPYIEKAELERNQLCRTRYTSRRGSKQ